MKAETSISSIRSMIRIIIADDEDLARQNMRRLLEPERGVQVVDECRDGEQAIAAVQTLRPDLLLLEVQMSDMDGFQILERIPVDQKPLVVFTSAHDQHAIRAFEANALDYLLKPFKQERLHRAVEKVRNELLKARYLSSRVPLDLLAQTSMAQTNMAQTNMAQTRSAQTNLVQTQAATKAVDQRFLIKAGKRLLFLDFDEIDWIEAAANYVKLNVGSTSYLLREGIGRISARLDPGAFIRVHRSTIVNVSKIKELQPCDSGEYIAVLRNGKELSCSRGCRAQLQQLIENKSLTA